MFISLQRTANLWCFTAMMLMKLRLFLAKADHYHVPIWMELQETFENITKIYCMGSCTLNVVLYTSMFQSKWKGLCFRGWRFELVVERVINANISLHTNIQLQSNVMSHTVVVFQHCLSVHVYDSKYDVYMLHTEWTKGLFKSSLIW